jgi:hypothetical protein
MGADLAALTPPLVVCVAFLIGVGLFLRRQMGTKRIPGDDDAADEFSGDDVIADPERSQSAGSTDHGDG